VVSALPQESHDRRATGTSAGESEAEARATERVITFSDAVIAIAITLLALALPVPGGTRGLTDGQFLTGLRGNWSDYLAFLISFLVIGSHWSSHRSVTRYMCGLNGMFMRLNMLWLLMMVLTPFAARVLSGSGSGASGARFTIYVLIQVVATACMMLMNRAVVRGNLLRRDAPERARHPDNVPYLATCVMFLLSVPVAFATATAWPYALWVASPLAARGLRRIVSQGRHATSEVGPGPAGGWTSLCAALRASASR
jgi:uncharacterized membrane protein